MDTLVTTWQAAYAYFNSIPASTWYAVAVFVGSSATVSGLVEVIKRRFYTKNNEQLAKHVVATVLGFSSFAITALQGFILYGTTNPRFLGDRTLEIVGFATLLYHFGLSNGYKKVAATLTKWVNNGRAYNSQIANSTTTYATTVDASTTAPTDDASQIL